MSEGRRVPIGILRQSEEIADSLVAECDALRARVKELEEDARLGRLVRLLKSETIRCGRSGSSMGWSPRGWWAEANVWIERYDETPEGALMASLGRSVTEGI